MLYEVEIEGVPESEIEEIEREVDRLVRECVTAEYARPMLETWDDTVDNSLMGLIVQNVIECSDYYENGTWTESDCKYAIGRMICAAIGTDIW